MPSLTDTILKVIVDSTGVKAGVNAAIQDLSRLESAAKGAANRIDNELKKLNRAGGGPKTGTSGFLNQTKEPPRPPGSVFGPPGFRRDFFEGREALVRQSLQTQQTFEEIGRANKIYQKAVSAATTELNSSAANERSLNIQRGKLQQAIQAEQFRLSSLSKSFNNSKSIRFGADDEESASFLNNLKPRTPNPNSIPALQRGLETERANKAFEEEIAERRRLRGVLKSLGNKEDLTGKSLDELRLALDAQVAKVREFNQRLAGSTIGRADQQAAQRAKGEADARRREASDAADRAAVAASLKADSDRRNRVISSLANQRLKAIEDPANLRALNRVERASGQTVSRPLQLPFSERAETAIGEFSEKATARISSVATTAFRRAGSFLVQEFTNFVSRVAANLTSRLISSIVEGIGILTTKAFESAAKFEDALVSFGVLAGGKDRGASLVGDLQKLAIDTPFRLQEVLDESKLLLSYGVAVDDLTKRLRQLGDVASGTGVDLGRLSLAFGQVLAKGRLQGPEIRQFTEAGVGIRDFVSAFNEVEGKKVGTQGFLALVEQGQVSSSVVEKAFDKMTSAGGRFFNLMEERSKTVRGRLNALTESIEIVAQRVGKSLFDKLGVGQGIDSIVKRLQGIDFGKIDSTVKDFAPPIQKFVVQLFAGIESVLRDFGQRLFGSLDSNGLDRFLKRVTEEFIPNVLRAGETIAQVFLSVGQAVLRFGQVVEAIARNLPGASGVGGAITALIAGATVSKFAPLALAPLLAGTALGGPLGIGALALGGGLLASGIVGSTGANLFGRASPGGNETYVTARFTSALGEASRQLERFRPGDRFEAEAKKAGQTRIREEQNRDLDRRQAIADRLNRQEVQLLPADLAAKDIERQDRAEKIGKELAEVINEEFDQARAKALDRRKAIAKELGVDIPLDGVLVNKGFKDDAQFGLAQRFELREVKDALAKLPQNLDRPFVFDENAKDPFKEIERARKEINDQLRAGVQREIAAGPLGRRVNAEDIAKTEKFAGDLGIAIENLRRRFEGLSDTAIPNLQKRMESIRTLVATPDLDPTKEFQNDLKTIDLLNSKLFQFLGIGITDEEARRARGKRGLEFTEKANIPEFQPAPLIRQASQEAEQALTKAIYENNNNNETPEDKLRRATEEQTKQTERLNKNIEKFGDALAPENRGQNFGAVGFGP